MTIDTDKMREAFGGDRVGTHYEGCQHVHPGCAIAALCNEVERLEALARDLLDNDPDDSDSDDDGTPQDEGADQ